MRALGGLFQERVYVFLDLEECASAWANFTRI